MSRMIPRLITITSSHYSEKARWALDRARIEYREEAHAPIFSRMATRGTGGTGSVPVLITDDGKFADSTDILRWVDRKLPLFHGDAAEVEDYLDENLGPPARDIGYVHISRDRKLARRVGLGGAPRTERFLGTLFFPFASRAMMKFYKIGPHTDAEAQAGLRKVFAAMDGRLADGRKFLCGDKLSAADIALGALAAPVVLPAQAKRYPMREECPESMWPIIDELRATATGKHILRLYAEERN
jgi:glutathione S-transferase